MSRCREQGAHASVGSRLGTLRRALPFLRLLLPGTLPASMRHRRAHDVGGCLARAGRNPFQDEVGELLGQEIAERPLNLAYALSGRVADTLPLLEQAIEQSAARGPWAHHALYVATLSKARRLAGRLEESR